MKKGVVCYIFLNTFLTLFALEHTHQTLTQVYDTSIQTSSAAIPSNTIASGITSTNNTTVQQITNTLTTAQQKAPFVQVPATLSERGTLQVIQTPAYQTFSAHFIELTNKVHNLFNSNGVVQPQLNMQWSVDGLAAGYAQATGAASLAQESSAQFQAQKQKWTAFIQCLQGTQEPSYMSVLQELANAYGDVQKDNEEILQTVFAHDSFFLHVVQTALGACQQCIHDTFITLQETGYTSASTQYFFNGDIQAQQGAPLQQIQSFVTALQKFCDNFFSQTQDATVSDEQKKMLQNNYLTLFTHYHQSLAVALYNFASAACNACTTHASITVIPTKQAAQVALPLDALDTLFSLCQSLVQFLPAGAFDTYASGQEALQALQQKIGQLHYYAAMVTENNLNNQIAAQASNTDTFLTSLQGLLKNTMQEYAASATYYKGLTSTSLYQVTTTRFKLYSLLFSYVTALVSQANTLSYEQATNYYNAAYQAALDGGLMELAAFFLSNLNVVYSAQVQNFLSSYCQNQMYQNDVKAQNIVDLFYTKNNALFQGIAVACQQAAQVYEAILSAEQSALQIFTPTQQQNIIDALTLTQNITILGQTLFLGTSSGDQQATSADSLLYEKYYDPSSVLQGQMLYAKTLFQAQKCDALLQKGENPYAPFTQLFGTGTSSLTTLLQEHSAYVAMQSAAFALQVADASSYDAYNQKCIFSALCSLIYAYKVYQSLNQTEWSSYLVQQIKTVVSQAKDLNVYIETLIKADNPDEYQQACVLAQALCIAGDQQGCAVYQQATKAFAQLLAQDTSPVTQLLQAFVLYRGMLAAGYAKDATTQNAYQKQIQALIASSSATLKSALQTVQDSKVAFAQKESAFMQLQALQATLNEIMVLQEYEQACFAQKIPFVVAKKTNTPQGLTTTVSFMNSITFTLPDISYLQAQYAQQQGQALQAKINEFVQNNEYNQDVQSLVEQTLHFYQQAKNLYRSLGMQNVVAVIDQAAAQTIGLSFLSAVIPTDSVQKSFPLSALSQVQSSMVPAVKTVPNSLISNNQNSSPMASWMRYVGTLSRHQNTALTLLTHMPALQENSTTGANNNTGQSLSSGATAQVAVQPLYVLRSWELNITQKQQELDALVQEVQKQLPAGHTPAPVIVAEQKLYTQLTTQIKALIAKKGSSAIETADIVPLFLQWYTLLLEQGGFVGVVLDFDQEIQMITQQLQMMISQGVTINGANSTTSFSIKEEESNGQKSLFLVASYLPLAPIARFRGDTLCASYYYQRYQMCFSKNMTPFIFQGSLYYPFADTTYYEYAQNQLVRTYLVALEQYQKAITQQIQPLQNLSLQQKQAASLTAYSKLYQNIEQSYLSLFALLANIQSMQQESNTPFSLQEEQSKLYQQAAQTTQMFLLGSPSDATYQSVMRKISAYYFYALLSTTDNATHTGLVHNIVQLNSNAGDTCVALSQTVPQIAGYPSLVPHNFPSRQTQVSANGLQCGNQPASYTFPATQNLSWYYYELAQAYYTQALQVMQKYGTSSGQTVLQSKVLMASVYAALQRITLCARNVFSVSSQQQGSDEFFKVTASKTFMPILQAGLSSGANTILQGEQNLMSGQQQVASSNALAQYALIRKTYLDGMIYFASVAQQSSQLAQMMSASNSRLASSTKLTNAVQTTLNGALSCAALYQFPSLSALVPSTKKGASPLVLPIMGISSKLPIDLSSMLTDNWQSMFLYADTFLSYVEYVAYTLLGNVSNSFATATSTNAQAFNAFMGQLTAIIRNVYAQIFMPTLFSQGNQTIVQTSIDAALQQEGQQLLINTTSYMG